MNLSYSHSTQFHRIARITIACLSLAFIPFIAGCGPEAKVAPVVNPPFPALPAALLISPGVELHIIHITGTGPGRPMDLNLYLPSGQHAAKSLPCVFIAPAGTGKHGGTIGDADRAEHIPYVKAGFAVMVYELSGDLPRVEGKDPTWGEMGAAVTQFMQAEGGLANARIGIDYALTMVPEINPDQLYACGHSSAGTMALNLAAEDGRLKACCAYAPCTDVETWWNSKNSRLEKFAPGFGEFAIRKSPLRNAAKIKCPVYLFHADDDSAVSVADQDAFIAAMKASGKDLTYKRVATGEHYRSMIVQGIPGGIAYMKSHGAVPAMP